MRKILLYGYGGAYNHGAEAILRSSIPVFRSAGVPIYLVTHFPEQDREFGIDRLADRLIPADFSFVPQERAAKGFEEKEKIAAEIYRSALSEIDGETICIGIGGDNYCYPNWHRQSLFHHTAKQRGAVSILWGCSVQPEMMDQRMADIFRQHDRIYARESLTAAALRGAGAERVFLLPDSAFLLEPEYVPGYDELNHVCAINLSPLMLRRSPYLICDFVEAARFLIKQGNRLLFLPHVCMPADNDQEALEALAQRLFPEEQACIVWCPKGFNAAQRKYLISRCRMLLCCRTHASIAGYSSGVPTLVVGYSVKSSGIGTDLQMADWVIPVEERERLSEKVSGLWSRLDDIRDKLRAACEEVKGRYSDAFASQGDFMD